MTNFRIVILVSSDRSDIYFANQLLKNFNIVGVFVEHQRVNVSKHIRFFKLLKMVTNPLKLADRISYIIYQRRYNRIYGSKIKSENDIQFGNESVQINADKS